MNPILSSFLFIACCLFFLFFLSLLSLLNCFLPLLYSIIISYSTNLPYMYMYMQLQFFCQKNFVIFVINPHTCTTHVGPNFCQAKIPDKFDKHFDRQKFGAIQYPFSLLFYFLLFLFYLFFFSFFRVYSMDLCQLVLM